MLDAILRAGKPDAWSRTWRQVDILHLLVRGHSDASIARALRLEITEVEEALRRLLECTGVRSRNELIAIISTTGA